MSATMYTGAAPAPAVWISGVCADIAGRAAVPVWLPRAAFVIFGVMHWLLAAILYLVLARLLHPRPARPSRASCAPPATAGFGNVREKFRNLDERLCNLEAATVRNESELRRAFRDLERKQV